TRMELSGELVRPTVKPERFCARPETGQISAVAAYDAALSCKRHLSLLPGMAPGQKQSMATADLCVFHGTSIVPLPLSKSSSQRPLHRVQQVRLQQGMSLRTAARQLGTDVRTIREQEEAASDLRLSE